MTNNQITLKLDGIVPLHLYTKALTNFTDLVTNLSKEIVGENKVDWTITDLQYGSATQTITGFADYPQDVEKTVVATELAMSKLIAGEIVPFSQDVEDSAIRLTSVLNGKITAIHLSTNSISSPITVYEPVKSSAEKRHLNPTMGIIIGTVRSISDKPNIKMTIYDSLFGKKIVCYLDEKFDNQVRNIWRKDVEVIGMIRRDSDSGRAIDVRNITSIKLIEKSEGGFLRARGIYELQNTSELPEETIRRIRNDL